MKTFWSFIGLSIGMFLGFMFLNTFPLLTFILLFGGMFLGRYIGRRIEEEKDNEYERAELERLRTKQQLDREIRRKREQYNEAIVLVHSYPEATKFYFKKYWGIEKSCITDSDITEEKVMTLLSMKSSYENDEIKFNPAFKGQKERQRERERLADERRKREEEEKRFKEEILKKKGEERKQMEEKCSEMTLSILHACSDEESRKLIYKAVVTKIALERACKYLILSQTLICKTVLKSDSYVTYGYDHKAYNFFEYKLTQENIIKKDISSKVQKIEFDVREIMSRKGQYKEKALFDLLLSKEKTFRRYVALLEYTKRRIRDISSNDFVNHKLKYPPLQEHIKTLKLELPKDNIEDYFFQELLNIIKEQELQSELDEQESKRKLEQDKLERERQEKIRRENERIERERRESERLEQIEREKREREQAKQNEFRSLCSCVSDWYCLLGGLHYNYLLKYFPTTCDFDATEDEWADRYTVWNFKNTPGKTSAYRHEETLDNIIPKIKNVLTQSFGSYNLHKLTLVCIPASNQENTVARYQEFSERLCNETGMENAFSRISVVHDKVERRSGGTSIKTDYLRFDSSFFKDKWILLFDDVITRGDSMRTFKFKMESLGAYVVAGFSIGKTKHER